MIKALHKEELNIIVVNVNAVINLIKAHLASSCECSATFMPSYLPADSTCRCHLISLQLHDEFRI